jgi:hypothetical protein
MALNITFDGFCYNDSGILNTGDMKYQAFFYKGSTGSSNSKWNDVRVSEVTGYYNFNLGDSDFLGQTSTVMTGSVVLVVFWRGNTNDRNSLCSGTYRLIEWGAFEITLTGLDVYTKDIQTKVNITPNILWSLPTNGFVDIVYSTVNNSDDAHSWTFGSTTMYHFRQRYGQNIQLINTIVSSDYDWDDGNQSNNLPGASAGSHSWSSAGIYNVVLTVEDECLETNTDIKSIEIKYNAPVPNIICHQAIGNSIQIPDTVVTFEYSGTDPNNKITSIDWTINDNSTYGNTQTIITGANKNDIIPHTNGIGTDWCGHPASNGAFTNPGSHLISIVVHWDDGFVDRTINYSESYIQYRYSGPTVNFNQIPPQATINSGISFNNVSSNIDRVGKGIPDCNEYDWSVNDSGLVTTELDKQYSYTFDYTPITTNCSVELCANWSDGWDTKYTCTSKNIVFSTTITVTPLDCYYNLFITGTSSNGTVVGYSWEIYKDTVSGTGIGPWSLIWSSPVSMSEQSKDVDFVEIGYYRIIGFAHGTGTTTYDDEIIYVDLVCPVCEGIIHIWNGTGLLDSGGDWEHQHSGFESIDAKHNGTNGLDASSLVNNDVITFHKNNPPVDIVDFDLLVLWLNIRYWQSGKNLKVKFHNVGEELNLDSYANLDINNEWQKVYIPLEDFNIPLGPGASKYVHTLLFTSEGNIGIYLDDIYFGVGSVYKTIIPVCEPNLSTTSFGGLSLNGLSIGTLSLDGGIINNVPEINSNNLIGGSLKVEDLKPGMSAYPLPNT